MKKAIYSLTIIPLLFLSLKVRGNYSIAVKITKCIILAFIIVVSSTCMIFSQTTGDYRSAISGSWGTRTNWQRWNGITWVTPTALQGAPTSASGVITILNSHNMTVAANVTVDQVVVNTGGTITINATRIFAVANGTGTDLMNNGTITNNGTIQVNGALINNGSYNENYWTYTNNAAAIITNNSGKTFTVSSSGQMSVATSGSSFTNNGTYLNNGVTLIQNNGTYNNNSLYNEGYNTSVGYTTSGTFNNNTGSIFNVISTSATTGGQLYIGYNTTGTFNNLGTLTNNCPDATYHGIAVNQGTLTNSGTFTNNGGAYIYINNYGLITTSLGYAITNNGNLICNGGGSTYVNSWDGYGLSINGGTLVNNGSIEIQEYGVIILYTSGSLITNNASGVITNYGGSYYSLNIGGLQSYYGGIYQYTNRSTLTNYGTIINKDASGYYAWDFNGDYYRGLLSLNNFNNYGICNNNNDYGNNTSVVSMSSGTFNNYSSGVLNNSGNVCIGAITGGNPSSQIVMNSGMYNENWATIVDDGSTFTNASAANVNISIDGSLRFCVAAGSGTQGINNGTIENLGSGAAPWAGITTDANTAFTNNNWVIDKGTIINNGSITNNNLFDYYMTKGSISGTKDFVYGTAGILLYHGSIAQTTSHWEFPSAGVPYVTVNNSNVSGLTLDASKLVIGSAAPILTLTNGPVNLNSNKLTIQNSATNAIVRTSGYILSNSLDQGFNSILQWNTDKVIGYFEFPFGVDASTYIPLGFNVKSGGAGNVAISTYRAGVSATNATTVYTNRPTIVNNLDGYAGNGNPGNAENIVKRFWKIEPSSQGVVDLTFTYPEEEIPITGEEANSMVAQRFNISTNLWDPPLPGQIGNTTTNTVKVSGVVNFSPWAISKKGQPLPVVFLNYEAKYINGKVEILWSTVSETNNDFFTVEKSKYLTDISIVGTVAGSGNSNDILNYAVTDKNPGVGTEYYRIRQTDYDGSFFVTDWMTVEVPINNAIGVSVDNSLSQINISFGNNISSNFEISVYDLVGHCIYSVKRPSDGESTIAIDMTDHAKGIYFVNISSENYKISKKVVIE